MQRVYAFFMLLLILGSCAKLANLTKKKDTKTTNLSLDYAKIDKVLNTALSYKGTPYQWGGTTRKGMDCSGLMLTSFKSIQMDIPRIAGDQAAIGISVKLDELEEGDMVFFTDKPGNKEVTHVGMVSKVNPLQGKVLFVHASSSKGVMESDLFSDYWKGVFLKATRPKIFIK